MLINLYGNNTIMQRFFPMSLSVSCCELYCIAHSGFVQFFPKAITDSRKSFIVTHIQDVQ